MNDESIVGLYWQRSPYATEETARKYGNMLKGISYRFLKNLQDSEECVNDTYFTAWNRMPNDRPIYLGAYLSKIVRNLSINRFRKITAEKRGGGDFTILTDELAECIPNREGDIETELETGMLRETLNCFLTSLDEQKRVIFLRRYFFSDGISDIAKRMGWSESKVKTTLFRIRAELRQLLEREGFL